MWRSNHFFLSRFLNEKNYSVIEGEWRVGVGVQVIIENIYSSGSLKEKKLTWEDNSEIRRSHSNRVWCVVGDFNSIRARRERKLVFNFRL